MTTIANDQLFLANKVERDDVITFGGADTLAKGTVLARIAATGKLGIYDDDSGTADLDTPVGVLDYEVVATGAGDVAVKVAIAGIVDESKLIEDSNPTTAFTDKMIDKILANTGLIPVQVRGL